MYELAIVRNRNKRVRSKINRTRIIWGVFTTGRSHYQMDCSVFLDDLQPALFFLGQKAKEIYDPR